MDVTLFSDAKDLIYEGIATKMRNVNIDKAVFCDAKDLIYEGIATSLHNSAIVGAGI